MKKLFAVLLTTLFSNFGNSQLNPSGLSLSIDGKLRLVEFWEASNDEEYGLSSGDTVFFLTNTVEGKQVGEMRDFEFLKQYGFEILGAGNPDENDYIISDPNDTTTYLSSLYLLNSSNYYPLTYTAVIFDTNLIHYPSDADVHQDNPVKKQFEDEIVYTGTMDKTDSLEVKSCLKDYILKRSGMDIDYDYFYDLRNVLSETDSVTDNQQAHYDYLVSRCTFHEYDQGKLVNSMSYYYLSGGIENDSIHYNSKGNITYFKRESVGITMTKVYIDYDKKQRVSKIKMEHYSYNSEYFDACPNCLDLYSSEEQLFTYKKGLISSRTTKYTWGKEVTEHCTELNYGHKIN